MNDSEMRNDLLLLLAQFKRHRTITHKVNPHECRTCTESDAIMEYIVQTYFSEKLLDKQLVMIGEQAKILYKE